MADFIAFNIFSSPPSLSLKKGRRIECKLKGSLSQKKMIHLAEIVLCRALIKQAVKAKVRLSRKNQIILDFFMTGMSLQGLTLPNREGTPPLMLQELVLR